ncbi:MAG: hypothetical protein EXQ67_01265, partial [Thermoleophilia bacterium]|nr:hypothetical protein [Thermoleophilia bacterium]
VAALSSLWSLSANNSVGTGILSAGYLGALALGVLLGPALRRPGVVFATGLTALATLASGWALVARSFPATTGVQLSPRLSGTLTIPNALAILALTGLFGGLALCAHRDRRYRAAGGAIASINMLALVLTSSRSGLGLALIGIIALQLVLPAAPRMRLVGLLAVIPAGICGFKIALWTAFTAPEQSVLPVGWGLIYALVGSAVLGAVIAAAAVRVLPGAQPAGHRGHASRRTLLIALSGMIILMIGFVVRTGGPSAAISAIRSGFAGPIGQAGVRVGIGSNLRDHWWATAWDGFRAEPWHGWGAGTFRLLEQITQDPMYVTDSAHNTLLEALSGTGLAGGVPFIVGGIALVVMAVVGVRRPRVGDEVGVTVVAIGAIAFLVQGLVDVDWNLLAQGILVYAAIGAIAPAPHQQARVTTPVRAIAGVVCIGLIFAGLLGVPTWLSARDTVRSEAILIDNPQAAYEAAASAHRYNPLAVEPLIAEADALQELGDTQGAQTVLLQAIALEPKNYEPWLVYGTYLAYAWNQLEMGRAALQQALKLSGNDNSVHVVVDTLPAAK